MKTRYLICVLLPLFFLIINGCKDNSVTPPSDSNMKLIGSYDTPGNANGVSVYGTGFSTYALIADDASGVELVNVSAQATPVLVSSYTTGGTAIDITNAIINGEQYAFVSCATGGYSIINFNVPQTPVLDTLIAFPNDRILTSYVDAINKIAYIGTYNGIVYIYSLSNLPTSVSMLSSYNHNLDNILGLQASSNVLYIASATTGLELVGITNPSAPQYLSGLNLPGTANGIKLNGNYVYMANAIGGIITVDVSNFINPVTKSIYNPSGLNYYGLVFNNFRLYTANGINGVEGVTVASVTSPLQTGFYHTQGSAYNIDWNNGYIYVADGSDGLIILQSLN